MKRERGKGYTAFQEHRRYVTNHLSLHQKPPKSCFKVPLNIFRKTPPNLSSALWRAYEKDVSGSDTDNRLSTTPACGKISPFKVEKEFWGHQQGLLPSLTIQLRSSHWEACLLISVRWYLLQEMFPLLFELFHSSVTVSYDGLYFEMEDCTFQGLKSRVCYYWGPERPISLQTIWLCTFAMFTIRNHNINLKILYIWIFLTQENLSSGRRVE